MHRSVRYLGVILLTTALAAPLSLSAKVVPQDDKKHEDKGKEDKAKGHYYDKNHKDYHDWNDKEESSFHIYLTEQKHPVVEFSTMKAKDQQKYWDWRHDHPDHDKR